MQRYDYDGVTVLPDNLYLDPRKRKGIYRYKRPDGTFKQLDGQHTVKEAIKLAKGANLHRGNHPRVTVQNEGTLTVIGALCEEFIEHANEQGLQITKTQQWRERYVPCIIRKFGAAMPMAPTKLTKDDIQQYWNSNSRYVQKHMRKPLRVCFAWLMAKGYFKQLGFNPFTSDDSLSYLTPAAMPAKKRQRLKENQFWGIYAKAGEMGYRGLQVAMRLCLITFMRQGDIRTLRFDEHVTETALRKMISKSVRNNDTATAKRLEWRFSDYPELKAVIDEARELSLMNNRCPYLVSHRGKQIKSKFKDHWCQIKNERFCEMFVEARDAWLVEQDVDPWAKEGRTRPTFHEVRSVAAALFMEQNKDRDDQTAVVRELQIAMAHSSMEQTLHYLKDHDIPFTRVKAAPETSESRKRNRILKLV